MSHTISVSQMAKYRLRVVDYAVETGNISKAARKYYITRQTVHRWVKRYDGTPGSLMDISRKPHSHPNAHTPEEIKKVSNVYRQNKKLGLVCLWLHLKKNHGYTRSISALYHLLRRLGIIPPPKKRKRRKSLPYEPILVPGERFQVDVKYVPNKCITGDISGRKLYQFTAIDECTRWRYLGVYDEISTYNSTRFVKELINVFPFEIQCIQTDNGSEFTSRLQGSMHPSAFESFLEEIGIRHKLIRVATPRHNGKVERSHRTDQERFYDGNKFYSLKYLKCQLARYLKKYNRTPLLVLNERSPQEFLNQYLEVL
jgi:transposase InsO family protein